jgi:hypothetical protein
MHLGENVTQAQTPNAMATAKKRDYIQQVVLC